MQGRLSPIINGMIQAFPWENWQKEFSDSSSIGFHLMEWTLDQANLYQNPLLTIDGQETIHQLKTANQISIPSLTGDCFMQSPFWKTSRKASIDLQEDFRNIVLACKEIGISTIVIPLVDNGGIENNKQEDSLVNFLNGEIEFLESNNISIAFESDYGPHEFRILIERFESCLFGVNYDIGNSAALGFEPKEEFQAYAAYILNVHIKDRKLHGTTVPLGDGDAKFPDVFYHLDQSNYSGNLILQTARSSNHDHKTPLVTYREKVLEWMMAYQN